jgi:hypothetical protein
LRSLVGDAGVTRSPPPPDAGHPGAAPVIVVVLRRPLAARVNVTEEGNSERDGDGEHTDIEGMNAHRPNC